jgi:hypothetical protein
MAQKKESKKKSEADERHEREAEIDRRLSKIIMPGIMKVPGKDDAKKA